ncbi:hypothetical protein ACPVBK_004769, partial [Salmonella enterica subsp. enterica serovar Kentucky]
SDRPAQNNSSQSTPGYVQQPGRKNSYFILQNLDDSGHSFVELLHQWFSQQPKNLGCSNHRYSQILWRP